MCVLEQCSCWHEDGRMMQFDKSLPILLVSVFGETGVSAFCGCCSLGPVPAVCTANSQLVFFKEINISEVKPPPHRAACGKLFQCSFAEMTECFLPFAALFGTESLPF